MPFIKKGGKKFEFEFNPKAIAGLMYMGIDVFPDDDATPEQIEEERGLVDEEHFSLWGDKPLRTVPGRDEKPNRSRNYFWEEDWNWLTDMNKRVGSSDFMKVLPNPKVRDRMPRFQNNPLNWLEAKQQPTKNLYDLDKLVEMTSLG